MKFMRAICASFITALAAVLTVTLPAQAQVKYGSVGAWNIQINENGACVLHAMYERDGFLIYGHLDAYEGLIYGDMSWTLPDNVSYALELVFNEDTRIPVVGTTFVSDGFSGIKIPFQDARLIMLFRFGNDMQIFSRESGKVVAHIALKDSNAAYDTWHRCADLYHYMPEANPFGSGQPASDMNPFERAS